MLSIVVIALVLRLIVVGWLVAREPNITTVCHLGRYQDDDSLYVYGHASSLAVYWDKYWKRVLGLQWPGGFVCPGCEERQEREFGRPVKHLETANGMEVLHERMAELNRSMKKK
jgi:hypothetical protein